MTRRKPHRIFLIEADSDLQNRMCKLITTNLGYEVSAFDSARSALETLETRKKEGVSLIISSYWMPGMKGDEVLHKARAISRQSLRMLISEVSDMEIMINAVNTAQIHACLVLPFTDTDLINQVKNTCRQYEVNQKKEHLNRVTRHQNHQLFKLAQEFRKIDAQQIHEIRKRSADMERLHREIEVFPDSLCLEPLTSVEDYLARQDADLGPQMLADQWKHLESQVYTLFCRFASEKDLPLCRVTYEKIKTGSRPEPEYRKAASDLLVPILDLLSQDTPEQDGEPMASFAAEGLLDDYLDLGFSRDGVKAFIKINQYDPKVLTLKSIKAFLQNRQVTCGVKTDEEIVSWIRGASETSLPFAVAEGRPPRFPQNAQVRYHFEEAYLRPGKLREDGTIDFTDRGKVPFVKKDTFLAAKTPPVPGAPGLTATGREILVPDPEDMVFEAGPGARMDPDGFKIYADADGQPTLDALGTVSVLSELAIHGDVDFQSGNVDFEGNVVVTGSIKEGFTVKAASLTCSQVEGGQIELTGDLNCSAGIINAKLVKVNGTIQARYINNCSVESFGDMIIQREIIDSKIQMSGRLINTHGSILASEICAKGGIETGSVGTDVSKPSTLTVGKDLYIGGLIAGIEKRQALHLEIISQLSGEIVDLTRENSQLHARISENAFVQDRAQLELKDIEKKKSDLKASGNMLAYHKIIRAAETLEKKIRQAEESIEMGFERQDALAQEIEQKRTRILELEKEIQSGEKEKNLYLEMSARKKSVPEVIVARKIMSENVIIGPNVQKKLRHPELRCRIIESKQVEDGQFFYGIQVIH